MIELSESLTSDHSNKDGPTAAQLADLDDNELMRYFRVCLHWGGLNFEVFRVERRGSHITSFFPPQINYKC